MGTLAAGMNRETRNQRVTVAREWKERGGWEGKKEKEEEGRGRSEGKEGEWSGGEGMINHRILHGLN